MKRHFDLSRTLSVAQLSLLGRYNSWLDMSEYSQLISESLPATIFFYTGNQTKTIDVQYPGKFNSRARVIITNSDENEIINCAILSDEDDTIDRGDSIILVTGWSRNKQYSGVDKSPVLGNDFAEWLVRKNVGMFITDLPCLANVTYLPEFEEVHKILATGDISVVTGINNINVLTPGLVHVSSIPMKIDCANWSFVRVIVSHD